MENVSAGRVWVLNPDAERELAGATQSTARHVAQMRERAELFAFLTLGEPSVLAVDLGGRRFSGELALAWCPTPSVLEAARRSGLAAGRAPSLEILRRVNDKQFPSRVCPEFTLPGRRVVQSSEELEPLPFPFRLKRPFGFAGKGQRVVDRRGRDDDRRWIDESLRQRPLVVEPELPELRQVSCHGVAAADSALVGRPVALTTDAYGAPVSVVRASLAAEVERRVVAVTREISSHLTSAGYFGPFGGDYALLDGQPYLLDLNARFTLGFSIGFGDERAVALSLVQRLYFPR